MKKVNAILLLSICFMMAIVVVESDSPMRLCGREYVRAVISICGEVHVKRQVQMDFSQDHTDPEYNLGFQELDKSQNFSPIPSEGQADRALQAMWVNSVERRQATPSLPTICCSIGCSAADIRLLC